MPYQHEPASGRTQESRAGGQAASKRARYSLAEFKSEVDFIMAQAPLGSGPSEQATAYQVYGCEYSWELGQEGQSALVRLHLSVQGRPVLTLECPLSPEIERLQRLERLRSMYYKALWLLGPMANRLVYCPASERWELLRGGRSYDIRQADTSEPEE
ncbi:hypothetical protein KIM372_15920 [Bombiscardovia nodaiensis]|uniref:Uncharacterized protein n=1 Tax=Bombiscardovia nodaiensis TaxID=2932181 RepID=A0ABM8B9Y0_9BIFI|nr:hypothetical protein KIM372_15920 [Bombiscardovia nodaiensis]